MQSLYINITFSFLRRLAKASINNDVEEIIGLCATQEQADIVASLRATDIVKLSRRFKVVDISIDQDALLYSIEKAKGGVTAYRDFKTAEMTSYLLREMSSLSADPDYHKHLTKQFNLSEQVIYQLSTLTLIDIANIIRTGIVFYDITANEDNLPMALEFIVEQNREEQTIFQLIEADASWPMISYITRMSKNSFQTMRKQRNMPPSAGGAPKQLTQEQSHAAYYAWFENKEKSFPERCVAVHKALGMGLRHLWPTIQELHRQEKGEKTQLA